MPTEWAGEAQVSIELGEAVRRLREARHLTQKELGIESHVHASSISRLESDRAPRPTIAVVERLAAALGTDPAWLTALARRVARDGASPPLEGGKSSEASAVRTFGSGLAWGDKHWTAEDFVLFHELAGRQVPIREIAAALGRSGASIRARARLEGLTLAGVRPHKVRSR